MPPAPRCTVVYVNFRTTVLLLDSLASLRRHQGHVDIEVVVVDNATPGFDRSLVLAADSDVVVVEAGENLGFGLGNNLGASRARGTHLWILNTDTIVGEDTDLGALLDFLDANQTHGAVLPWVVDGQGRPQVAQAGNLPSPGRLLVEVAAQLLPVDGLAGGARVDLPVRTARDRDVAWATAAALVVRRSAFEEVGGFSPEYFFYLEDVDLCRRLGDAGHLIRWAPSLATVTHLGGRSMSDDVDRRRRYQRGLQTYTRRWHGRSALFLVTQLGRLAVARSSVRARRHRTAT